MSDRQCSLACPAAVAEMAWVGERALQRGLVAAPASSGVRT